MTDTTSVTSAVDPSTTGLLGVLAGILASPLLSRVVVPLLNLLRGILPFLGVRVQSGARAAEEERQRIEVRLSKLEHDHEQLQAQHVAKIEEAARLGGKLEALTHTLNMLERALSDARNELLEAKNELTATRKELTDARSEISKLQGQIDALSRALEVERVRQRQRA